METNEIKAMLVDIQQELDQSDKMLTRFLEDMLLILLRKGVIERSEVPEIVLERIARRQVLRDDMHRLSKQLYKTSV